MTSSALGLRDITGKQQNGVHQGHNIKNTT